MESQLEYDLGSYNISSLAHHRMKAFGCLRNGGKACFRLRLPSRVTRIRRTEARHSLVGLVEAHKSRVTGSPVQDRMVCSVTKTGFLEWPLAHGIVAGHHFPLIRCFVC
jgi:hypothetical protein